MIMGKSKLRLSRLRRQLLITLCSFGCLVIPGTNLAAADVLPPDYGYMLIRVKLSLRERVDQLAMTNVETNEVISIHADQFEQAGLNAWMALMTMPAGRYFLGMYQPSYGTTAAEVQRFPTLHKMDVPDSDSDIFEIVPGVVNYAGDWTLRVDMSRRAKLTTVIEFDKSTLERYVENYPEYANQYSIYLSVMGGKAISLEELANRAE